MKYLVKSSGIFESWLVSDLETDSKWVNHTIEGGHVLTNIHISGQLNS